MTKPIKINTDFCDSELLVFSALLDTFCRINKDKMVVYPQKGIILEEGTSLREDIIMFRNACQCDIRRQMRLLSDLVSDSTDHVFYWEDFLYEFYEEEDPIYMSLEQNVHNAIRYVFQTYLELITLIATLYELKDQRVTILCDKSIGFVTLLREYAFTFGGRILKEFKCLEKLDQDLSRKQLEKELTVATEAFSNQIRFYKKYLDTKLLTKNQMKNNYTETKESKKDNKDNSLKKKRSGEEDLIT